MQMLGAALFCFLAQAFAQFFGALGRVGKAFEQRAQIESRSGGEDRQLAAAAHIFEHVERAPAIFPGGENFLGLDEIHQMMRNAALLGE